MLEYSRESRVQRCAFSNSIRRFIIYLIDRMSNEKLAKMWTYGWYFCMHKVELPVQLNYCLVVTYKGIYRACGKGKTLNSIFPPTIRHVEHPVRLTHYYTWCALTICEISSKPVTRISSSLGSNFHGRIAGISSLMQRETVLAHSNFITELSSSGYQIYHELIHG